LAGLLVMFAHFGITNFAAVSVNRQIHTVSDV